MTPEAPGPEGTRPTPTRRRPGGRSARIRTQMLDAVRAELGEHGYDGLSMDAVAARAGVHRTTVYRRWGTSAACSPTFSTRRATTTGCHRTPAHWKGTWQR